MKTAKKIIIFLSSITLLFVVSCSLYVLFDREDSLSASRVASESETPSDNTPSPEPVKTAAPSPEPTPTEVPAFQEYDITLMAVGDNLIHMGIVHTGKQPDGSLDYSVLFEGISEYLDVADLKIINQETILGGNQRGFSGYPYFNSPTEVGDAIADAGFNVVLQASNHSADQGVDGLVHCAQFWEQYPEILVTGIYTDKQAASSLPVTQDDLGNIPLITIKDITFAVLNYTYGPNMEVIPEDLEGYLELLCAYDTDSNRLNFTALNPQVLKDIETAKTLADVVIVCPHWGTEYITTPSSYQQEFALQMTQAGADLIIGTHPHVVQPVEWIEAENGNRALCYYSLGNYVSTQKDGLSMLEAMAWVTFHVTEDDVFIQEDNTGAIPLVCHYTSGPVRLEKVYSLADYTSADASRHGIHSYGGANLTLEDLTVWAEEILSNWVINPNITATEF